MIAIDFEYYRANSVAEAIELFGTLHNEGKSPLFYNGGTEIITLMRVNSHQYNKAKAVIDIKFIPECTFTGFKDDQFVIGSAVSLARLEEMCEFPLLSKSCSRIADHTTREKITIGGNICGTIKYKEALLPLLLTDSDLLIADESSINKVPVRQIFDQKVKLTPDSFIVQILIHKKFLDLPYVNKKILRVGRIGYPLLTLSAIFFENQVKFAFSGLTKFPFHSSRVDDALNDQEKSIDERLKAAIEHFPGAISDDLHGSSAYREFVLQNVVEETLAELQGGPSK